MSHEQQNENQELAEQKIPSSEKRLSQELFREPGESEQAYLWRSAGTIGKTLSYGTNIERMTEDELPLGVRENIKQAVAQASLEGMPSAPSQERSEEDWDKFQRSIGEHFIGDYSDSDGFDQTIRDRGFFRFNDSGRPSGKRETYWNTLFFSFNTEETRELAKKLLDEKKVVLLGGGRSELQHELQAHDIHPQSITNIDPFVENPTSGADAVISVSASDKALGEKLPPDYTGKVDEVWAEYSVPAYLQSEEEIQQLMQNIDTLLIPGGVARIWPVMVGGAASGDSTARQEALYQNVRALVDQKGYELVTYTACGRPGMTLVKPKESPNERLTDEERIARAMHVLEQGEDIVGEKRLSIEPGLVVPDEFRNTPLQYFREHGLNIKPGETEYKEDGRISEDPTAVKCLPVWHDRQGNPIRVIAKKINTVKSQIGKSGNPWHEVDVMKRVAEAGLPVARLLAVAEENGEHLFVTERVAGFTVYDTEMLDEKFGVHGYTKEDIETLKDQVKTIMESLKGELEGVGVIREKWKLQDMVFEIDFAEKKVTRVTPVDWERTKLVDSER